MSLRQPTSTLDRYEPRIPGVLPLDTLPKNAVLPAQPTDARLSRASPVWTLEIPVEHAVYGGSAVKAQITPAPGSNWFARSFQPEVDTSVFMGPELCLHAAIVCYGEF